MADRAPSALACRVAHVDDAEDVARLHIASWRDAYRGMLPDRFLAGLDVAARTTVWADEISHADTVVMLVESDGNLLGFCAAGPSRDADATSSLVSQIYNLHVAPHAKGRGIGTLLFSDAANRAIEAGRHTMTLWVASQNASAQRFYRARGMVPDGASQLHTVGPDAVLSEVRFRMTLGRESLDGRK